ncbi:hypothetical protein L798_10610 [Zootermopsis nevadensis]|uniref:Uncharacterized protein n=1 Tax=Zootermopsis nevadensis TaxID=136037 RepID=A0A067QY46_ZOONE|nr:hypothetical protein L798_10610 [Zootermopsis nevadensis]
MGLFDGTTSSLWWYARANESQGHDLHIWQSLPHILHSPLGPIMLTNLKTTDLFWCMPRACPSRNEWADFSLLATLLFS